MGYRFKDCRNFGDVRAEFKKGEEALLKQIAEEVKLAFKISLNVKEARRLYTIAAQLFQRLWWDKSRKRKDRYKKSKQGESFADLAAHYKWLNNFPPCLDSICQDLRGKVALLAHDLLSEIPPSPDIDPIGDAYVVDFVNAGLKDICPATIEDLQREIAGIKLKGPNPWAKQELKHASIQRVLIPLIMHNLLRNFKSNPQSLIGRPIV
jgi:hypothetical protein